MITQDCKFEAAKTKVVKMVMYFTQYRSIFYGVAIQPLRTLLQKRKAMNKWLGNNCMHIIICTTPSLYGHPSTKQRREVRKADLLLRTIICKNRQVLNKQCGRNFRYRLMFIF